MPNPTRRQRLAAELRPILDCTGTGTALATGSRTLINRGKAWIAAADTREAALGRVGALLTGCAVTAKSVEMWPATGTALAGAWVIAAWMHAPPPPPAPTEPAAGPPEETPEEPPAEPPGEEPDSVPLTEDRTAFLEWLADLIGDANGIHLDPLWEALREEPGCALPRTQLGPLLDRLQVPVQRTVSVGGVAGRSGVRRGDVEAALTALPQEEPKPLPKTGESGPDLRKSQPLSTALTPALSPSQET